MSTKERSTMDDSSDGDLVVELNMDHPLNIEIMEFMQNAPTGVVNAWMCRQMRRAEFVSAMDAIGGLTKYRRKMVVRSLVRMFRAGYRSGRLAAFYDTRDGNEDEK